ncbi:MAG: RIP metalloprotease RseP, partial [Cyanobacteria bacterium P01_H01_bin.130]
LDFLMEQIRGSSNASLPITLERGDRTLSVNVTPEPDADGVGRIGVQLAPNGKTVYRRSLNPAEIFGKAADQFQAMVFQIIGGFIALASNFQETASQVSGPVKIVEWGANIAESQAAQLLPFVALISINLAVVNILPLPALDGGQLFFLIIEALRGRPLPQRLQESVMQTGLVLLLGLGVVLIVRDTTQLEWVQNLFQQ